MNKNIKRCIGVVISVSMLSLTLSVPTHAAEPGFLWIEAESGTVVKSSENIETNIGLLPAMQAAFWHKSEESTNAGYSLNAKFTSPEEYVDVDLTFTAPNDGKYDIWAAVATPNSQF